MRSVLCAILVCGLIAFSLPLAAQAPNVYVSTGATQQILTLDGNSGNILGICNVPFVPEDVVLGPDGKLYAANPAGNQIFRLAPPAPPIVAGAGCLNVETVYSAAAGGCSNVSGGATTCPTGPEGPSFLSINTPDLYFNTHGNSGVWKVANAAGMASCSGTCGPAKQVLGAFGSGEGTEFDIFGNLYAVDQANSRVMRALAPAFNGATAFITSNLSSPFGIALNTCGDLLVASGKYVNRYSSTSGAFLDRISFSGNDLPKFLELDAGNRLFVTTANSGDSGSGGKVWRFDPPGSGTPSAVTSCALGSYSQVWVQTLKNTTGLLASNALGLGLAASSFSITQTLNTANGFTANFNFGAQHTFSMACKAAATPSFTMTVTAARSQPNDAAVPEVQFTPATNWPGTPTSQCPVPLVKPTCVHYGSQHGFCTQYLEAVNGTTDPSAATSACPGNFTFKVGFFTAEFINDPGGAHSTGTTTGDPYAECQSQDFYNTAGPGLDSGVRLDGSNSKHVMFNSPLDPNNNGTITLTSPASSCDPTTGVCNPQFNAGQNIAVKFDLRRANGTGITTASEQLSILRVQHTTRGVVTHELVPQTVRSTNNSQTLNFFSVNGSGQYSYNDDSSAFDPLPRGTVAVYQFTLWGNGAAPFTFNVVVQF